MSAITRKKKVAKKRTKADDHYPAPRDLARGRSLCGRRFRFTKERLAGIRECVYRNGHVSAMCPDCAHVLDEAYFGEGNAPDHFPIHDPARAKRLANERWDADVRRMYVRKQQRARERATLTR